MRSLAVVAILLVIGCASPLVEAPLGAVEPAAEDDGLRRWSIVTTGDQPPSCHEKLAAEGQGLAEDPLGIPFEIVHLDQLRDLRLSSLSYSVDGACVFSWDRDGGSDAPPDQLNVARGQLSPGEHEVALVAGFRGAEAAPSSPRRGELRGTFVVHLEGATRLFVKSYERGGLTAPVENRAALQFELGELTSPRVLLRSRP